MRPRSKRAPRKIAAPAPKQSRAAAKPAEENDRAADRARRLPARAESAGFDRRVPLRCSRCAECGGRFRAVMIRRAAFGCRPLNLPGALKRDSARPNQSEGRRRPSAANDSAAPAAAFFCRSNRSGAFSGALGAPRGFKEPAGLRIGLGVGFEVEVEVCRRRFASACGWFDRGNRHGIGHGLEVGVVAGVGAASASERVGPRGSDGRDCGWGGNVWDGGENRIEKTAHRVCDPARGGEGGLRWSAEW